MTLDITVAIPTIASRGGKLRQAISSALVQTHPVSAFSIAVDRNREGSAATRNRALNAVQTDWTAFLDDDDQFLPNHLEKLSALVVTENADIAYALPRVINANGREVPRAHDWGGGPEFDPDYLRVKAHIQTTCLVRTELAKQVGFQFITDTTGASNDDHGFFLGLLDAGAKFAHLHEPTFIWNHHGGNTSGRPTKGDALR